MTTIHRAKGNEADVVYVVGLDRVGKAEASLTLRNQLFVAMSRSRGWLHLSSTAAEHTAFGQEVRRVLEAGMDFTFYRGSPSRILNDADDALEGD